MDASPAAAPEVEKQPWRIPRIAWALVPAALFVLLLTIASAGGPPGPGDPAPSFDAPLLAGGGTLGSAELTGSPYVLNFWASWCAPCRDEAPMLERASKTYEGRVTIVGINVKDTTKNALRFVSKWDVSYPQVRDETRDIYGDYGLTGQPETFFVDASGTIVQHVNGPLSDDALAELLDALVARGG